MLKIIIYGFSKFNLEWMMRCVSYKNIMWYFSIIGFIGRSVIIGKLIILVVYRLVSYRKDGDYIYLYKLDFFFSLECMIVCGYI